LHILGYGRRSKECVTNLFVHIFPLWRLKIKLSCKNRQRSEVNVFLIAQHYELDAGSVQAKEIVLYEIYPDDLVAGPEQIGESLQGSFRCSKVER
jgi:hypothetical protein